ncbi:hypothetical protein MTR67_045004 [Solanum verrucosum]|uniref:Uncharacterized protein n=1 Tax=Solanum verrucosum TaxID=315347 RepID=A0AAF0ZWK8_SOLVR|nr:hypothetical protein MTR67_045004 [Solanum verrucosum]
MAQKVAEEEEEWGKCLVAEARAIYAMISINLEKDWIEDLEYNVADHVEEKETDVVGMKQEIFEDVLSGDRLSTPESVVSLFAFRRTQLFCVLSFCFIRMLRGLSQHPSQYFRGFIDRHYSVEVSAELRKPGQGFAWGQKWSPGAGPAQGVGSGRDIIEEIKEVDYEQAVSETVYVSGDLHREIINEGLLEAEVSSQSFAISRLITSLEKILEANGDDEYQIDKEVDLESQISCGERVDIIIGSFENEKYFIKELRRKCGGESCASDEASQEIDD